MASWLKKLFGSPSAPPPAPTPAPSPTPRPAAPAAAIREPAPTTPGGPPTERSHLALLAKFKHGSDPASAAQDCWANVLPDTVPNTLALFRRNGWLVDAPWQQVFATQHRVDELKPLLKERGLKVSGKKDELVERLIAADPDAMRLRVAGVKAWMLSALAESPVESYLARERDAEALAQSTAIDALRAGNLDAAVSTIVVFERSRLFPRGIGIDWHGEGIGRHIAERAGHILNASPGILRDVPEHELALLRPVAAMLELTGESRAKAWLPPGLVGHPRLDIETVVRMLLFHGSNTARLEGMRAAGYKRVEVSGSGDGCPACLPMDGKKFALSKAPELPHPGCTHAMGCRCLYQAVFEE